MAKAKFRVMSGGFTQVVPPAAVGLPPTTRIRTFGEVFELDEDEAAQVAAGVLMRVDGDIDATPPALPDRLAPDAAVRLATGDGVHLTAGDFRSVEQVAAELAMAGDAAVGVVTEKPKATASTEDWANFAVGRGLEVDVLTDFKRDDIRALFDDEATDRSTAAWRTYAIAAGFEAVDLDGKDRDDIRSLFFE